MKILALVEDGNSILTQSWTAKGPIKGGRVTIHYMISGMTGYQFLAGATGVGKIKLNLTMTQFLKRLSQNENIVDLQNYCA